MKLAHQQEIQNLEECLQPSSLMMYSVGVASQPCLTVDIGPRITVGPPRVLVLDVEVCHGIQRLFFSGLEMNIFSNSYFRWYRTPGQNSVRYDMGPIPAVAPVDYAVLIYVYHVL